jgi:pre-mRNA-splicing factor ATP-dependent RNA helicase DHX15/PRP43
MCAIVALLSAPNIFLRPKDAAKEADTCKAQYAHYDGDHLTLLNAYYAYKQIQEQSSSTITTWCYDQFLNYRSLQQVDNIYSQLQRIMNKLQLPLISVSMADENYYENIKQCLTAGLFMQVAHLQRQGHYLTVKDQQVVAIHPSSVISDTKPTWILFQEFVLTSRNYIRTVTITRLEWLISMAPHYYDLENWPDGETKQEIEKGYRRYMQEQQTRKQKIKKIK